MEKQEEENKGEQTAIWKSGSLFKHIKELGKHGAVYGFGSLMGRLVGFFLIPLYAHFLSPADYGVLQLIYITTETVSIIIGLRLATTVFRLYHEGNTVEEKNTVISTALMGVIGLGVMVIIPLILLSPGLSALVLDGKGQSVLLRIALLSLCLQFPSSIAMSYMQIKEKSFLYVGISLSKMLVSAGLNIYFVVVLRSNITGILISGLIVDIVSTSILVPWLITKCGLRFSSRWFREMIRFGFPLVPSSLASMVTHVSDRYFIKGYLSLADTGVYSLGYKMGNSIHSFFYVPFSQIWNTRRFVIESEPDAKQIYAKVLTYFIAVMSFAGLGMSLFAKDIIRILSSEEYWGAGSIIPLVVLSYVIYSMEDHVSTGIWLKKKTERISVVVLLSGAANIGLNFLLIPYLGMYGAVLATLLSFMVRNAGLYYFSNEVYPIPFEWGRLFLIFGFSIILYLISNSLSWRIIWPRIVINLGLWLCYPLMFYGFLLDKEEKGKVKSILVLLRGKLRLYWSVSMKRETKEY